MGKPRSPVRKRPRVASTAAPRRVPQQDRSRATVNSILRSARLLFGEGRDVSVRKIADKAGVPIASVYQYFPDKNALLRALSLRYYERMNARLEEALMRIERMEQVPAFADAMIDVLFLELGAARSHMNVWAASQSDEVLRKLDMKEALHQAGLVTARLKELAPAVDPGAIRDICTFAVVMAGPVIRHSFVMPKPEAARLIGEFKDIIRARAETLSAMAAASRCSEGEAAKVSGAEADRRPSLEPRTS
jgi:AcrR family transcriptional regulator